MSDSILKPRFRLIFSDVQVLRTHRRPEHREKHEARGLTASQLVLALQRTRPGRIMIVLLHRLEAWNAVDLLYHFNQFSSVQLFKPKQKHALRSSFDLVAKNVQPHAYCPKMTLIPGNGCSGMQHLEANMELGKHDVKASTDYVKTMFGEFGSQLVELGRPVWQIQANALNFMLMNKWY